MKTPTEEGVHLEPPVGSIVRAGARALRRVLPRRRECLTLVYHMGKVGSTSIFESLVAAGIDNIHHLNRLDPDNIERVREGYRSQNLPVPPGDDEGLRVYDGIRESSPKIKCISPVRDPFRRNISAFFFTLKLFMGKSCDAKNVDMDELKHGFINAYAHDVPLTWFDVEMRHTLGVDVYAHAFPREQGYLMIRQDNVEVLLLHCELADAAKEAVVREFTGVSSFRLRNENQARDKTYAEIYKRFLEFVTLPETLVDRICNSTYTQHFYTENQIDAMRERWLGRAESQ